MKNKFLFALAIVGILSLSFCGTKPAESTEGADTTATTTEPAAVDTTAADTTATDTTAAQ
jgi:hypothetical protein